MQTCAEPRVRIAAVNTAEQVDGSVRDNCNGSFAVRYTVQGHGPYRIGVEIDGVAIKDSKFDLVVARALLEAQASGSGLVEVVAGTTVRAMHEGASFELACKHVHESTPRPAPPRPVPPRPASPRFATRPPALMSLGVCLSTCRCTCLCT